MPSKVSEKQRQTVCLGFPYRVSFNLSWHRLFPLLIVHGSDRSYRPLRFTFYVLRSSSATYTFFSSVYPSIAPIPRSRPRPLCLNPPKGASTCTLLCELTLNTPLSTCREMRSARFRSFVQSEPLRP